MDEEAKEIKMESKKDIRRLSEDIITLGALRDGDTDWSEQAYDGLGRLIDKLQALLESRKVGFYDEYIKKT